MNRADPAPRLLSPVIAICLAVYVLDGLIHTILGPLAPGIARDLSLGNAELGPLFSSNLIGQCIGLVVFPVLAGRIGDRLAVTLAVLGFALGQCASALAQDGGTLFAIRLLTGVFLGGCLPSCLAIVTERAAHERLGVAILLLFAGYGFGAAVAGAVAAGFAEHGGWRAAMLAVGLVSLAAAAGAWSMLRGASEGGGHAKGEAQPAPAPWRLLGPAYVIGTLMLWLLFIVMLTISYCLNSWLPTMLVGAGFDESFAALSITIFGIGGVIAALGVGMLVDRFGAMPVLVGFCLAAAVALFASGRFMTVESKGMLTALLGAAGFFSLGAYGGVNVVLSRFYPAALRATGIGWAKSIGRIGTVIAPVLIGWALDAGLGGPAIMSGFAIPALIAALTLLAIAATATWRRVGVRPPGQVSEAA